MAGGRAEVAGPGPDHVCGGVERRREASPPPSSGEVSLSSFQIKVVRHIKRDNDASHFRRNDGSCTSSSSHDQTSGLCVHNNPLLISRDCT